MAGKHYRACDGGAHGRRHNIWAAWFQHCFRAGCLAWLSGWGVRAFLLQVSYVSGLDSGKISGTATKRRELQRSNGLRFIIVCYNM